MAPVLGAERTDEVIRQVASLEKVKNVRELGRPLVKAKPGKRKTKPRRKGK